MHGDAELPADRCAGGIEYWDRVAISDEQMQLESHGLYFTISIDLKGETWHYCIDKGPGVSGTCGDREL